MFRQRLKQMRKGLDSRERGQPEDSLNSTPLSFMIMNRIKYQEPRSTCFLTPTVLTALQPQGFFIRTEREDRKICAITAAHAFIPVFGSPPEGKDWALTEKLIRVPVRLSHNYIKTNPQQNNVSFYPTTFPEETILLAKAINSNTFNTVPGRNDYTTDLALLLLDESSLRDAQEIQKLDVDYLPTKVTPAPGQPPLIVKGHPHAWPLNKSLVTDATSHEDFFEIPDHYYFMDVALEGAVAPGSSGSPVVMNNGRIYKAIGLMAGEFTGTEFARVSSLTPLKESIEKHCRQRKKGQFVFATTAMNAGIVFAKGLIAEGDNRDVVGHVSGTSGNAGHAASAFVSTTASQALAHERAEGWLAANPGKEINIYRIRADHRFYNAESSLNETLRNYKNNGVSAPALTFSRSGLAEEYLFLDDNINKSILPAENIVEVISLKREGKKSSFTLTANNRYQPAQTEASPYSYVGPLPDKTYGTWVAKIPNSTLTGANLMPGSIPDNVKKFPAEIIFHTEL